jgi:hypothetical protein
MYLTIIINQQPTFLQCDVLCLWRGCSNSNKMQKLENHIDGEWHTSYHDVLGFRSVIKMREGHGCKIHIEMPGKIKTLRYNFASESFLIDSAKQWLIKNKFAQSVTPKSAP